MDRAKSVLILTGSLALFVAAHSPWAAAGQADTPLHKRVTVDYANRPLAEALKDLGEKAGVRFAWTDPLLDGADPVTYQGKDQEAGRVAVRILRPRELGLEKTDGNALTVVKLDRRDEFKVKREAVFEFAEKPTIARDGDQVTIAFATKGFCDVTVAIEDAQGQIVRHLASGVLGENAPEPFQWNSKRQILVWDGKNDKEEYIDDKDSHTVRVSLGLNPRYERPLFWSPHKRLSSYPPIVCAAPEGVYVYEGYTTDSVRLYDHDGNYVRTIYPFPAAQLDQVMGLEKQTVLQTGQSLPRKLGAQKATMLTSGTTCITSQMTAHGGALGATAMAVLGDRMALAFLHLNRLRTDGSSGGLPLKGPKTGDVGLPGWDDPYVQFGPSSAAFSPDGKTLYLTGYLLSHLGYYVRENGWARQGVYTLAYEKDEPPEVFAGDMKLDGYGDDNAHFAVPTSVACDAKGRVYVADFMNNRVQIYSPDGRYLKTLSTPWPCKVQIDPRSQDIHVYSWFLTGYPAWIGDGICNGLLKKHKLEPAAVKTYTPNLSRFGPFEDPKPLGRSPLPISAVAAVRSADNVGPSFQMEIDFWAKPPTLWLVGRRGTVTPRAIADVGQRAFQHAEGGWERTESGIKLFVQEGDRWVLRRAFADDAAKAVACTRRAGYGVQRLYVHPKTHMLYILEGASTHGDLIEIDPGTGQVRMLPLPFTAEDICFDSDGLIYLRGQSEVVRYEFPAWREVPWDYGEERPRVGYQYGGKWAATLSALPLPAFGVPVWQFQSGLWVSPKGHLAVACWNPPPEAKPDTGRGLWGRGGEREEARSSRAERYAPPTYPGRNRVQEIHVWDRHGKLVSQDAVPGLGFCNGLGLDKDDNLYALFEAPRCIDGKAYAHDEQGTLVKFPARKAGRAGARVLTQSNRMPVPLPESQVPKRPPDTVQSGFWNVNIGQTWMSGAEWMYGGAGVVGWYCHCYHTRFQLDAFARSFVPEPDLCSVAVLDANGNLILRVGRYGNPDDGLPLVPNTGIPAPRSIGGDEVALVNPAYVGVDTDRRLFVADLHQRIVSVKLGYRAEEKIALKDVKEAAGK